MRRTAGASHAALLQRCCCAARVWKQPRAAARTRRRGARSPPRPRAPARRGGCSTCNLHSEWIIHQLCLSELNLSNCVTTFWKIRGLVLSCTRPNFATNKSLERSQRDLKDLRALFGRKYPNSDIHSFAPVKSNLDRNRLLCS